MTKNTLVIDTAFDTCQIGLVRDNQVIAQDRKAGGGQHDRILAGMVKTLFDARRLTAADLNHILVTTGPGRFTGLRVGIAFARGLSLVHKTPLTGVLTTDAIALDLAEKYPDEHSLGVIVTVKRGESFLRFLRLVDSGIEIIPDDQLVAQLKARGNPLLGGVVSPVVDCLLKEAFIRHDPAIGEPSLGAILAAGQTSIGSDKVVRPYYAASYAG